MKPCSYQTKLSQSRVAVSRWRVSG